MQNEMCVKELAVAFAEKAGAGLNARLRRLLQGIAGQIANTRGECTLFIECLKNTSGLKEDQVWSGLGTLRDLGLIEYGQSSAVLGQIALDISLLDYPDFLRERGVT